MAAIPFAIWAFTALVAMQEGKAADGSLLAISKFLHSPRLETRIQAANALGALGTRAKSRIPMLIAMLKDTETNGVWAACNALGRVGEATDKVVTALLDVVGHKDPNKASAAVTALGTLRANTTRVTDTLDKMRDNKELDHNLRGVIDQALVDLKKPKK